ncbi:hypothetical protein [Allorhodopirellula heiligendammensis]|uniref:Uncharacterized protein n=1 Tax=Allorhodopirellula heiligendammensis TaxID=2714739 RepID=A0A5C6C6C4_9BACT|nr:hypothetical protein [Allorhodopirellula heiligendammensis]TWU19031.1 hypothetical protein Poly21_12020 [Allorhodopirellula heiligendammensis]
MWPLTNGMRCLTGAEAALFRGSAGMMLDQLTTAYNAELADLSGGTVADESAGGYGFLAPHWFSMWEPEQRIWLLERVTTALLTARSAPPHSAIFEATVEAVYIELADLVAMEITTGLPIERGSWRGALLDAFVQRCPEDSLLGALQFEATTLDPCLPPSLTRQWKAEQARADTDSESPQNQSSESGQSGTGGEPDWMAWWTSVIERLVDATYGVRLYQAAERYRDDDPKRLRRFLKSKGVNDKFLQRIPPLRSRVQTQAAIDRLQAIVFQDD